MSAVTFPSKVKSMGTRCVVSDQDGACYMEAAVNDVELVGERVTKSDVLTPEDLLYFKTMLLEKKHTILEQARTIVESKKICLDSNEMKDEIDLASITIEQNLTFRLLERSRKLLKEIERALSKIESGDYGYCEGTGEMIPKKRLHLAPWVRHGVEFKQVLERRKKLMR